MTPQQFAEGVRKKLEPGFAARYGKHILTDDLFGAALDLSLDPDPQTAFHAAYALEYAFFAAPERFVPFHARFVDSFLAAASTAVGGRAARRDDPVPDARRLARPAQPGRQNLPANPPPEKTLILTTFPLRDPSSHPGSSTRIIHAKRRPFPNGSPNVPKTSAEKRKAEAERQTLVKERNEAIRQFNAQKAAER